MAIDSSIALDISGARIKIDSDPPDPALIGHIKADFGLYESRNPGDHPPLAQQAVIRLHAGVRQSAEFKDLIPQGALLCSEDPLREFQWWQHESFNYEIWGERALIISDRDEYSQVYCRPAVSSYPFVRAEIVRCLRAQLNHRNIILFHAGLASSPDGSRAVLIPGVKSQGKTSTVLWLVESGLHLHSDEMVLCRASERGCECWGIPRRFALTAGAITRYFPQYQYALEMPLMEAPFTEEKKHLFHLRGAHPKHPPQPSLAQFLIAPQLWRSGHSQILPMEADEVQAVLYGSCEFNHFPEYELNRFTHQLARQVQGYRLMIGRDSLVNFRTLSAHLERLGLTSLVPEPKGIA